jgi:hypothetical protein
MNLLGSISDFVIAPKQQLAKLLATYPTLKIDLVERAPELS